MSFVQTVAPKTMPTLEKASVNKKVIDAIQLSFTIEYKIQAAYRSGLSIIISGTHRAALKNTHDIGYHLFRESVRLHIS